MTLLSIWLTWLACTPPVDPGDSGGTDTALCTHYADSDGDGYGNPAIRTNNCELSGYVADDTDCDDRDPDIHPGADEFCNTLDDDCDGDIDEGDIPLQTWYRDRDVDGYGVDDDVVESCEPPDGYAKASGDCDDTDPEIHPGATEACDGLDEDCDDEIDEDGVDGATWYLDADGDGHGVTTDVRPACTQPDGYAAESDDCDDTDDTRFPGNDEVCDNVDNDCDDEIDESAVDAPAWFLDADGDGYGDSSVVVVACDAPTDMVSDATDCDDDDATAWPGAPEVCDGDDEDCDTEIDEGVQTTWFRDEDGDGYGLDSVTTTACDLPSGYAAQGGDCNDSDGGIRPGAAEGCDGVDEDCDTVIDNDPVDGETFYSDADGDGHGDLSAPVVACEQTTGLVTTSDDCDDTDPGVHPDAAEVCDGVDQDCDTDIDEGVTSPWYGDLDGDSYGDATTEVQECSAPSGMIADGTDCDDSDATIHPGATEVCDGVDQDCDTDVDEGVLTTYYADLDADGYGDPANSLDACSLPSGYVENSDDCYDLNSTANPTQTSYFTADRGDGDYDWDCNGTEDQEFPDSATCAVDEKGHCRGDAGWEDTPPACGDSDDYVANCNSGAVTEDECRAKTATKTQSCR